MLNLDECAQELSTAYLERAALNRIIWQAGQELATRERELRPEAGWPGKNDEARAAAKDAALAADQRVANAIANAIAERNNAQVDLATLEAQIAGIEAQRRAAEWRIRERMVEGLTRAGIDEQSRGDRMEAGPDDQLQHEWDSHLAQEAAQSAAQPIQETTEFPF